MKQLIPQSKIDDAANEFSKDIRENSLSGSNVGKQQYQVGRKIGFNAGVQFALNEIQPFVCEFAEWTANNKYKFRWIESAKEKRWINGTVSSLTTQQLLEEFIEFKNKQS